ncbi:MAG TPA: phage Gp37/Gp68 family protein [Candidatus Angelobacter sp.]|jgi:protein gp37|nr:phage Gp37/Gp68 family protein [Candidatus Angelobacter sp.]
MAQNSSIEWTDATWNPIRGCTRVSDGCRNCYAERVAIRFSGKGQAYDGLAKITNGHPQWTGKVAFVEKHLNDPLKWKEPRRIFVNSMSDLFHEQLSDECVQKIFKVMCQAKQHVFQVLTKRPKRMLEFLSRWNSMTRDFGPLYPNTWPQKHIWLGVSCENQATADERIPLLLQTPAATRWISAEPLLGPIDLHRGGFTLLEPVKSPSGQPWPGLNWVVAGGESGPGARPMHPDWARSLRDQCKAAGVAFFFKQWGEFADLTNEPDGSELHEKSTHDLIFSADGKTFGAGYRSGRESNGMVETGWKKNGGAWMGRIGKKAAGRKLDGFEHSEYPQQRAEAAA